MMTFVDAINFCFGLPLAKPLAITAMIRDIEQLQRLKSYVAETLLNIKYFKNQDIKDRSSLPVPTNKFILFLTLTQNKKPMSDTEITTISINIYSLIFATSSEIKSYETTP